MEVGRLRDSERLLRARFTSLERSTVKSERGEGVSMVMVRGLVGERYVSRSMAGDS